MKTIDLNQLRPPIEHEYIHNLLMKLHTADEYKELTKKASLAHFVKTGETLVKKGKNPCVYCSGIAEDDWLVVDAEIGIFNVNKNRYTKGDYYFDIMVAPWEGRVLGRKTSKQKYLLIFNGDEEFNEDIDTEYTLRNLKLESLTISFECLKMFYNRATTHDICSWLQNEQLKIVDYTPDDSIPFSKEESKVYNKWVEKKAKTLPLTPPLGYSRLLGLREWHRAATVLLYDADDDFSILMGQDEDTYFGCHLKDNPKTVVSAFKSLQPEAVRKCKKTVYRQGEWFAVPIEEPKLTDRVAVISGQAVLPRNSEEEAEHIVVAPEICVLKDGTVCALDASVCHSNNDHADLNTPGWVAYHCNTAVRSFTVEGVD